MRGRDSIIKIFHRFILTGFILNLAVSCATKKNFVELQQDIYQQGTITESRLTALEYSVAVIDSLVREQYRLSQSVRALIGTQSQEQRDNVTLLSARQDEITYQLRELLQRLEAIQLYGGVEARPQQEASPLPSAQMPIPSPLTSTPRPSPSLKPSEPTPLQTRAVMLPDTLTVNPKVLYDSALDDLQNERYPLAESRFLSFLMQFPDHELAGNAQYWLGESDYGQKKYELAISEFDKVLKKYPKSPKVPAALLKTGFAQMELGNKKEGIQTLNRLIKSYPNAEEVVLARERLKTP